MGLSNRLKIDLAFGSALLILVFVGLVSYRSVRALQRDQDEVHHAEAVLREVEEMASHLKDAETGQRGFLLTRQDRFLEPYVAAVSLLRDDLAQLRALVQEPAQRVRLAGVEALIQRRMALVDSTVRLGRGGRFDEAARVVAEGEGRELVDETRGAIRRMGMYEMELAQARQREVSLTARRTVAIVLLASLLAVLVVAPSRMRMLAELRARESAEGTAALSAAAIRSLYDVAEARDRSFDQKVDALLRVGCDRFGLSNGLLSRIVDDGISIVAAIDPTGDLRAAGPATADHPCTGRSGLQTHIDAPVFVNGEPFGTLCFSDPLPRDRPFTADETDFLRLMAQWVGGELRDGAAVFEVHDTGRGIPADKLELIFERFQQVDSSDARQKGGTGLGLSIARSIVQQHGGEMWVESRWGAGSTFYFSLPSGSGRDAAPGDNRPLILLCDDDPGVAALVQVYLEREDFRVHLAATGEQALTAARELQPAAILLDLHLPGMSGYEVLRLLRGRAETMRIPVVVLTGCGEDSGLDLAEVMGWVEKPIDREALVTAVRWAAARKQEHFHVLVLEDNEDLSGVISEMLRQHGLKTSRARTGREAIDLSRRISYDLLLLDPGLPEVDGFGVVDWLRRHNRHRNVPVMVYTARELDEAQRERLRLGPTEFVVKTRVTPEELERRVVALLDEMIAGGQTLER